MRTAERFSATKRIPKRPAPSPEKVPVKKKPRAANPKMSKMLEEKEIINVEKEGKNVEKGIMNKTDPVEAFKQGQQYTLKMMKELQYAASISQTIQSTWQSNNFDAAERLLIMMKENKDQ